MGSAIGNVTQNRALTEMAMDYARSRVLCAAARLGIADHLNDGERSVDELAAACGAEPVSMHRLLRALASFGIVIEKSPKRFALAPLGQALRKEASDSEWSAVVFWGELIADSWSQLTECIRTGDNAMQIMQRDGVTPRWSKEPNAMAIFGAVMGTAPAEDYMPIARAWDFSKYQTVADLGGGEGALIEAVLRLHKNTQGILVDRPHAMARARARFEANGLSQRCQIMAADLSEAVPSGADVYMMKHFLHGMKDEAALEILRQCRSVVPQNGRLLIIEFILPDIVDRVDPELEKRLMSDLNMLAVTGGKERSAIEWRNLLDKAGYQCLDIVPVRGDLVSIVEAIPRR